MGWSTYEADLRSTTASSSEFREEDEEMETTAFSFLLGDAGFVELEGWLEPFHCAVWDGRATDVVAVFAL